jgi:hypothetical protein
VACPARRAASSGEAKGRAGMVKRFTPFEPATIAPIEAI